MPVLYKVIQIEIYYAFFFKFFVIFQTLICFEELSITRHLKYLIFQV